MRVRRIFQNMIKRSKMSKLETFTVATNQLCLGLVSQLVIHQMI